MPADTISIPLPQWTQEEFYGQVIASAAAQLLATYVPEYDHETGIEDVVRRPTELERQLKQHIEGLVKEEARALAPLIGQEILEDGIQQYDTYGYKRGEKKPLKQVIAEEIAKELAPSRNSSGRGGLLEQLIREEVGSQLKNELKGTIAEAKSKALEVVKTETANAIAQALERALPAVR